MTRGDDRTTQTLRDIIEFSEQAERLVAHGVEEFESNEFLRLAAEAIIHRLGEAVNRLPQDFIIEHPDVSWRAMKGTRNIVAHNYNAVDYRIIWRALSENVPNDAARIGTILGLAE